MEERMLEKTPDYFNVTDIFGENVFNDTVMQERLPKKIYKNLKKNGLLPLTLLKIVLKQR